MIFIFNMRARVFKLCLCERCPLCDFDLFKLSDKTAFVVWFPPPQKKNAHIFVKYIVSFLRFRKNDLKIDIK